MSTDTLIPPVSSTMVTPDSFKLSADFMFNSRNIYTTDGFFTHLQIQVPALEYQTPKLAEQYHIYVRDKLQENLGISAGDVPEPWGHYPAPYESIDFLVENNPALCKHVIGLLKQGNVKLTVNGYPYPADKDHPLFKTLDTPENLPIALESFANLSALIDQTVSEANEKFGPLRKNLPYTAESVSSPEFINCTVLDTGEMDYSSAVLGRKSAKTVVRRALGGELIETKNAQGQTESAYIAEKDDAIFVNIHNPTDIYVPGDPSGKRWAFSELKERGYEVVEEISPDEVVVKSTKTFKVLPEVVVRPTCIKDAWGPGAHQFLYEGATLKLDDLGRTTGIDRDAFNKTWEVISAESNVPALPRLSAKQVKTYGTS